MRLNRQWPPVGLDENFHQELFRMMVIGVQIQLETFAPHAEHQ
jgi:hypothetical protein